MHLKFKTPIYSIILMFVFLMAGCGSSDDSNPAGTYSFTNVPSKYSVTIPTSIKNTESKIIARNRFGSKISVPKKSASKAGEASFAYQELQTEVWMLREFFKEFDIEFMMIDASYARVMELM